jgi:hypothetical protein
MQVDFSSIVGLADWEKYWELCEELITELHKCQAVADTIRARVIDAVQRQPT